MRVRRRVPAVVLALCAGVVTSLGACADGGERLDHAAADDSDAAPAGNDDAASRGAGVDELPSQPAAFGPPYPIILVHGFSGWTDLGPVEYFYRVVDDLRSTGADVTAPALPPYDSSSERARVLGIVIDDVLARTHARKVHLIAHSQGGIDSRFVATELGYAPKIASISTISTPHRGTAIADVVQYTPEGLVNPAGRLLGWLLGAFEGDPPSDASWADDETVQRAFDPQLYASMQSMRPSSMEAFNASHPDPEGVPIFSVAGVSNLRTLHHDDCTGSVWGIPDGHDVVEPFFAGPGLYLNTTDGGNVGSPTPNDGLVTARSARWGTFLGCVPADHADEIGQIADAGPDLVSGFDHLALYRRLVDNVRDVEAHEDDNTGSTP